MPTKKNNCFLIIPFVCYLLIAVCENAHPSMLAPGLSKKKYDELSDKFESSYTKKAKAIKMGKLKWKHAQSKHFILHYGNKMQLLKAYNECMFYLKTICEDLQLKQVPENMDKLHIWIFPNSTSWKSFCYKIHYNPLSPGLASANHRECFVNFSTLGRKGSGLIAHELTHLVLGTVIRLQPPIWYHEGFAEYEEDEAYARLKNVRVNPDYMDVEFQRIIPLDELVQMTKYPKTGYRGDETHLFYNHSELLVRIIIRQYGLKNFLQLGKLLAKGTPFNQAVKIALRTDPDTLKKIYETEARKYFR